MPNVLRTAGSFVEPEAKQVVLDQEQQQIYMYGATLSFFGVPCSNSLLSIGLARCHAANWVACAVSIGPSGRGLPSWRNLFPCVRDDADLSITPLIHVTGGSRLGPKF